MVCTKCGSDTKVTNTRKEENNRLRRTRKCLECGHNYRTIEIDENEFYKLQNENEVLKRSLKSN